MRGECGKHSIVYDLIRNGYIVCRRVEFFIVILRSITHSQFILADNNTICIGGHIEAHDPNNVLR